jgi:hypothetical protein
MQVTQAYALFNAITKEILGETAVVNEDLSNFTDIGKQILDVTEVDNYMRTLIDQIGKMDFGVRKYRGKMLSVLRESWEYASVRMKIDMPDLPEAVENKSWDLTDGTTYNQDEFHKPSVTARFFNSKVTLEVDMSYTELQVKESLQSPAQFMALVGMIRTAVDNSLTLKTEAVVKRTINNAIAETVVDCFGTSSPDYTQAGNNRCINLLKLYNTETGNSLTAAKAIKDPDFLRYAAFIMGLYKDRLTEESKLFNIGGYAKFTPADKLHVIMLSEFERGANVYLYGNKGEFKADQYANFPAADTVSAWQGTGTDYAFSSTSKINVKDASGDTVEFSGILSVMFDHEALGVANENRRDRTHVNDKAEFFSVFTKEDCTSWNDMNENFILFYVA